MGLRSAALWLGLTTILPFVLSRTSYDFVVVGGGTAGLAVATRLSQSLPNCTIVVLEAGPDGRQAAALYTPKLSGVGTIYDWNFTTTPQPAANNRVWPQNRGKVLGGSSALNLLSWDRGAKADYDSWEELGSEGWNWSTMYHAMTQQETFQNSPVNGSAELVGVGEDGPIHFLINRFTTAQQESFFPTMQRLGVEQTYEYLNGDPIGWMRHTSNILGTNYTRSYSPTFLAYAGSNLHVMVNTTVAKLNLDHTKCVKGVTLRDGTVIEAKKEVILSAGSVQSPQLLELSGIGNASILARAGVRPLVHLPGVGENLQDHIRVLNSYRLKPNYTTADKLRYDTNFTASQLHNYNLNISGFYDETANAYAYLNWQQVLSNATHLTALGHAAASPSNPVDQRKLRNLVDLSKRVPQLEIIFHDGYLGVKGYPPPNSTLYGQQFLTLIASVQHAFARGSTHINSPTLTAHPVFNPNYLSNAYDLHAVAQAAKYLRRIASTPPMSYTWLDEYEPGLDVVQTDADWIEYAKDNALSIWHPIGTCALLPASEGGVVSPELKVYGVAGLRVVDASVIPATISGHIQTAVYGVAERAAAMIAAEWG